MNADTTLPAVAVAADEGKLFAVSGYIDNLQPAEHRTRRRSADNHIAAMYVDTDDGTTFGAIKNASPNAFDFGEFGHGERL